MKYKGRGKIREWILRITIMKTMLSLIVFLAFSANLFSQSPSTPPATKFGLANAYYLENDPFNLATEASSFELFHTWHLSGAFYLGAMVSKTFSSQDSLNAFLLGLQADWYFAGGNVSIGASPQVAIIEVNSLAETYFKFDLHTRYHLKKPGMYAQLGGSLIDDQFLYKFAIGILWF